MSNPPFTANSPRTRLVQVILVALMVAFSVMSYFERTIMSIAGPEIMKEFGLSETQMGSVYSAFIFSYALLMIPGGHLADRFGPRLVLSLMGFGAGLFTGLTAFGGRPGLGSLIGIVPAFLIMRLGMGVFTAPLYPSCARMGANWFPPSKQAQVWGFVASGAGIGSALSPPLFVWMMKRYGWRLSFWQSAAAAALLAMIWSWCAHDHPAEHPWIANPESNFSPLANQATLKNQPAPTPWRKLLTNRNLVLLVVGYVTVAYFEYIFFFWIYYYFGKIRRMEPSETTLYTTAIFVTWTVMTPVGGWVSDRLVERYGRKAGRRLVPMVGITSGALLLYWGTKTTSPAVTAALLSLSLGLASASDGPFWAAASDIGGNEVGAACGILNTGGNAGGFIAPVLTPFIASYFGWSWGLYFGCLVAVAGVLIWFFVDSTRVITDSEALKLQMHAN